MVGCVGQIQCSPTEILPPDFIGRDTKYHVPLRWVRASISPEKQMLFVPSCHDTLVSLKISDGKRIRALLFVNIIHGVSEHFTSAIFLFCLTMYMIWARRMFRKGKY